MSSADAQLARFHRRIAEKTAEAASAPVLIVAIGDSVTQGITLPDRIEHDAVYHARFKRRLERQYPGCVFSVINAGVNGQTVVDALPRVGRDVTRHHPDLVLIAFGLNDAALLKRPHIDEFEESLDRMIQAIHEQTEADVMLLTPNPMLSEPNQRVPACYRQFEPLLLEIQSSGTLEAFVQRIRKLGRQRRCAVVDVYRAWMDLGRQGVDINAMLSNGLNHPTAEAHRIAADLLIRTVLEAAPR